jgi:hypothetical protein
MYTDEERQIDAFIDSIVREFEVDDQIYAVAKAMRASSNMLASPHMHRWVTENRDRILEMGRLGLLNEENQNETG